MPIPLHPGPAGPILSHISVQAAEGEGGPGRGWSQVLQSLAVQLPLSSCLMWVEGAAYWTGTDDLNPAAPLGKGGGLT